MKSEILNVTKKAIFDEKIINYDYHTHEQFSLNYSHGYEISIVIQHQDLYTF